jgi:hypothetical protein
MSTMHDDTGVVPVEANTKKKPEIVLFYNDTKGAVDTLDKMTHADTTKRKTNRWPMVLFNNTLDVATVAARCVWPLKYPDDPLSGKDTRSKFIRSVSEQLLLPQLKRRLTQSTLPRSLYDLTAKAVTRFQQTSVQDLSTSVVSRKRRRLSCEPEVAASGDGPAECKKRCRCSFCPWKADRKTNVKCSKCLTYVCPTHVKKVCPSCYLGQC